MKRKSIHLVHFFLILHVVEKYSVSNTYLVNYKKYRESSFRASIKYNVYEYIKILNYLSTIWQRKVLSIQLDKYWCMFHGTHKYDVTETRAKSVLINCSRRTHFPSPLTLAWLGSIIHSLWVIALKEL